MNTILKTYYNIDANANIKNYFLYNQNYYYIDKFENIDEFLRIYHLYQMNMKQCQLAGYTLIQNTLGDIHTLNHVLLQYQSFPLQLERYLHVFLSPLPMSLSVKNIKEQWIEKIDYIKECTKEYAYSYKANIDIVSLIYYYCGVAESAVILLNNILQENPNATLSMCLSLKRNILPYNYELLNPTYYMYSTRIRHLMHLYKSHIVDIDLLKILLDLHYFEKHEIDYLYARMLYPSEFFDDVIYKRLDISHLENHFYNVKKYMNMMQELTNLLTNYITIPKISWIQQKNML